MSYPPSFLVGKVYACVLMPFDNIALRDGDGRRADAQTDNLVHRQATATSHCVLNSFGAFCMQSIVMSAFDECFTSDCC